MKITVDVDCSPEEARAFLGLPDVKPMQAALMQEIEERMTASLRAMQPDELLEALASREPQGLRTDGRRLFAHGRRQARLTHVCGPERLAVGAAINLC